MPYELMKSREKFAQRIGEAIQANVKLALANAGVTQHTSTEMHEMREAAEWSVVLVGHALAEWESKFEQEMKEPSPW
jgi:hypothetical protein